MTVHNNNTKDPSIYDQEETDFWNVVKQKCSKVDSRTLTKRIPSARWLPKYKREFIPYDFIAGLTVALTAIPQGIAYAVLAGLPPQYGLYSEIMPGIMYMIFGSTSYITIGPTAIMALMIQPFVKIHPAFAILGSFAVGAIILLLGVLNLGFIVDFISLPVTVGFTAAAAITIGSSQIKSLLGQPGSGNEFLESWINVFKYITDVKLYDSLLGLSTIILLLLLKKVGTLKKWPMFCKYVALSRNAIVVILGTVLAFLLSQSNGTVPFGITGQVASGFPAVQAPAFSVEVNGTTLSFVDMLSEMGTSLLFIPVVAILEMVAVAKAFSHGKIIDASQELIALGMSSMMGSFVSGMPVTGSFTRTALNDASGVRTPFGGIYTSILVLSALGLLTGTFYYIPKPVLAGVILVAVLSMIEYSTVPYLWKTKKIDLLPLFLTLLTGLFLGLDLGIIVGVGLNLIFILQKSARPQIPHELKAFGEQELILVTPDQSLCFSSSEYVRSHVTKLANKYMSAEWIVIDGHHINHVDATLATGFNTLNNDLVYLKKTLIFWRWQQKPLGVLYRANPNFLNHFKHSETIEELIHELSSVNNGSEITIPHLDNN